MIRVGQLTDTLTIPEIPEMFEVATFLQNDAFGLRLLQNITALNSKEHFNAARMLIKDVKMLYPAPQGAVAVPQGIGKLSLCSHCATLSHIALHVNNIFLL